VPKARSSLLQGLLRALRNRAARSDLFEDLPRNLVDRASIGMTTVAACRGHAELTDIDAEGEHIHNVTEDLHHGLERAVAWFAADSASPGRHGARVSLPTASDPDG